MDFVRADVKHFDAIISGLTRLKFEVSGTECMQLADHLAWLGNLRAIADTEASAVEKNERERVIAGLALLREKEIAAEAEKLRETVTEDERSYEPSIPPVAAKRGKLKG